jgi:hypothetical protein
LTALAFMLIIGTPERFGSGKPIASYLWCRRRSPAEIGDESDYRRNIAVTPTIRTNIREGTMASILAARKLAQ